MVEDKVMIKIDYVGVIGFNMEVFARHYFTF